MSKWIGYAVTVNCGEPLGCYQGTILEADGTTVTLTKAFRNGFPYPKSQVTLNAADIKELKIIESAPEPGEQAHSTVPVSKSKKGARATVCETLQASHGAGSVGSGASGGGGGAKGAARGGAAAAAGAPARSKPIDIQGPRGNKPATHAGSFGNSGSTPKAKAGGAGGAGGAARRRNEACFGAAAVEPMDDDFDFEGNLALFDKRALWEQMRGARPDLLRTAPDASYRCDENVLGGGGGGEGGGGVALRVPERWRGPRDYVTDGGARVAAVAPALRRELWAALARLGLAEFSGALAARAAADVALRLVGGGRRLEPRNAHQAPRVVALAGAHAAGARGLAAARVLAAHGARAHALLPAAAPGPPGPLAREAAAARAAGVALTSSPAALPSPDLVLVALYDPQLDDPQEPYAAALAWAQESRAAIVALEPPARGWERLAVRASVLALAPPALCPELGRVFLANVAAPQQMYSERGIEYRPAFGASSLLALHPADE